MSNFLNFLVAMWLPLLIAGLIGLFLGWLFFRGRKVEGDLSVEGEGALRAEADSLRARVQELEGRVSTRDGEISDLKGKLAAGAVGAAAAGAAASAIAGTGAKEDDGSDDTYALEWRNRYLAARVKYLEGQISEADAAPAKKPAAKKAPAKKKTAAKKAPAKKAPAKKKTAAKKTTAKKAAAASAAGAATLTAAGKPRKKPGPKPGTKRGALTAAGKPRKKPGPKPGSKRGTKKSDADKAFDKYYADVLRYDSKARKPVVKGIVKHCGIALSTRDGRLVACSDESELKTVADGFVTKKLGKSSGQMDLVKEICEQMKGDRFKQRVTFYYLAAKKARKLGQFT